MPILNDSVRNQLKEALDPLPREVDLVWSSGPGGEPAEFMEGLLKEMEEVVPGLHVVPGAETPEVEPGLGEGGLLEGPVLEIRPRGEIPYGVRFLGATAGLEFGSLVQSIRMVAEGGGDLKKDTVDTLQTITRPVHIQVFTTPT